jgi:hypothetical protein
VFWTDKELLFARPPVIDAARVTAKTYTLDLSFLDSNGYKATYCRDQDGRPDSLQMEKDIPVDRDTKVEVKLNAGGGFVARFTK